MSYSDFPRGSEWRKWDLHVHTPLSYHNSFPDWDTYLSRLKERAVQHDIEVVGITDYFCTDGYEKLLLECAENERYSKPRISLSNGKYLYLLPIVELRLDNFTGDNSSVNLHIAFSPAILPSTIKNSFLETLDIKYQDKVLKCKESDLIKIGDAEENSGRFNVNLDIESLDQPAKKRLVKKALSAITFSSSTFETQLNNFDKLLTQAGIKRESYLIIIANKGHGGLSDFKWQDIQRNTSRSGMIRQNLLNLTDICFSNSEDDKAFLLGQTPGTSKEEVLERFRTIKPCVWGSDAHNIEQLFHPSSGATNDYTWIKADPTFEGLKQTLYEPEERVKIQSLRPDIKNERNIISELTFLDEGVLFGNQTILLNENLNAIIGGKSSGKSLLLYAAAKSIDPLQVENASRRLNFEGYTFNTDFNFEVVWKNGEKDIYHGEDQEKGHKITYIPQLYINYLVEKNNKEELNALIKGILLQDSQFKNFYETEFYSISELTNRINANLSSYLQIRLRLNEIMTRRKDVGTSDAINKGIDDLEKQVSAGQKLSTLSEKEFEEYTALINEKTKTENQDKLSKEKASILRKVLNEVEAAKNSLLGTDSEEFDYPVRGEVDRILDEMTEITPDVKDIIQKLGADYVTLITNLRARIDSLSLVNEQTRLQQSLAMINTRLQPYLNKLASQQELRKLIAQVDREKAKRDQALALEKQYQTTLEDYKNLRLQTSQLLKDRNRKYQDIVSKINAEKHNIGSGITLSANLIYKLSGLQLFEQANKAAIAREHYFNTLFIDGKVNFEMLPDLFAQLLRVINNTLQIDDRSIPLKTNVSIEDVLRGLVEDKLEIDYTVTYKGDDLLNMSPGKKGTVLLILFLQISSSEHPILIDQPEDNLDNRTIYDLLCQMIKEKKKERQIIIVSHNANLVVATDTENIIVANQEGQGVTIAAGRSRFEYVNGAIEHSFDKIDTISEILLQQGIKEHVCDILEGGNEAFKQRELKYGL